MIDMITIQYEKAGVADLNDIASLHLEFVA